MKSIRNLLFKPGRETRQHGCSSRNQDIVIEFSFYCHITFLKVNKEVLQYTWRPFRQLHQLISLQSQGSSASQQPWNVPYQFLFRSHLEVWKSWVKARKYFSWTVVSRDSFWSTLISPETKQNLSFISLTISKSEVLLNAYPLIWRSFAKFFVTCLPAISSLSNWALSKFPWKTGIQCVTPSPESTRRAVSRPSAYKDIKAWYPYWSRSQPNF